MNPGLRVIGAHFGSMEDHLDDLANRLDLYPNFAVDTAARTISLVRQPREKVRAFMMKYQNRILYGSDFHYYPGTTGIEAAHACEAQYAMDWRYFSSDDVFEYRGLKVEGLNLPLPVLHKLYHDNAVQWIPGIVRSQH
jgi:predicted TIM-barrel fold metal-dependent hydrolase